MPNFNVFMWMQQNDGTKQRVFFSADNKREAIEIAKEKQHLTKDKIIVRQLNKNTTMYETFLVLNS